MHLSSLRKAGFTLYEIMGAILILSILISATWVATAPYMARSRDTSRIADIASLGNIFSAYRQSMDAFPSNFGSGGNALAQGFCISEIVTRPDGTTPDMKFSNLTKGSGIPKERALPIPLLCSGGTSYTYIVHQVGQDEYAFIASTLENQPSANLGNRGYLRNNPANDARILQLFTGDKNGIQMSDGDSIHYISMK